MVMLTGFMEGYRQQRDNLNRRRRDLAQAFNEFKAANPTATFDEYQSFIDQYAGDGLGSNYLRGGAPSQDVLRGMAERNDKVRQAQEQQRLLDSLNRRGQMDGQLRGMADDVLLNMSDDDYDTAYQNFIDRLGGEEAEERFGRERLQGYVTPNRLNSLANEQLRTRLPEIREYVSTVNAEEIDEKDLAETFGIQNPAVLSPLVSRAQELNRRQRQEEAQRNRMAISDALNQAISQGDPNPVESVKNLFPNADHESLQSLYQSAQQRAQQQQQERDLANRREVVTLGNEVRRNIMSDSNIEASIATGDSQSAKSQMLDVARDSLTPEDFERVYGVPPDQATPDTFSDEYDRMLNRIQLGQQNQYEQYRTEREQAVEERIREFRESNTNTALTRIQGAYADDDMAQGIVEELSTKYRMDARALAAFEQAYQRALDSGDVTSAAGVINAIENDPTFNETAMPLDDVVSQIRTSLEPMSRRPFDSWAKELQSDINQNYQDFEASLSNIQREEDPNRKQLAIQQVRRNLLLARQEIATQIKRARDEQATWVEYGTGGFNDAEADRIQQSAMARLQQIEQRLARIQTQMQEEQTGGGESGGTGTSSPAPRQNPSPSQTTGYSPNQQTDPTWLTEWWNSVQENMPANRGNPLGDR